MKAVGIRELRQNASQVIDAAAGGATFHVTNHGKETGVVIGRQWALPRDAAEKRPGASPEQIIASGVYDGPKPDAYEAEMLTLVERGRDQSGRFGGR